MPSSTSSSDQRLPRGRWLTVWLLAGLLVLMSLALPEWWLRAHGWTPSLPDTPQRWSRERERAARLGDQALILVGSSRIQLGLDLDEIRRHTRLEPVMLAIDGTSPVPILADLAADPGITGTLILSLIENNIEGDYSGDGSLDWLASYRAWKLDRLPPYRQLENRIEEWLAERLVLRLEGARPWTVLRRLLSDPDSHGNYLLTRPDRSRDADYSKVTMPEFYALRVARHLDLLAIPAGTNYSDHLDAYARYISTLEPRDERVFMAGSQSLLDDIARIEARGGRVILIRMPSDGLIREADRRRYPRSRFWDRLASRHPDSYHFEDYPELSGYQLPDGSHLDIRDKRAFTRHLMQITAPRPGGEP